MKNPITYGWVLFRIVGGKPEFMGIFESEEVALRETELLCELQPEDIAWRVKCVPFIGWGKVLFSSNDEQRGNYRMSVH